MYEYEDIDVDDVGSCYVYFSLPQELFTISIMYVTYVASLMCWVYARLLAPRYVCNIPLWVDSFMLVTINPR